MPPFGREIHAKTASLSGKTHRLKMTSNTRWLLLALLAKEKEYFFHGAASTLWF
jgi:hypothetical protein